MITNSENKLIELSENEYSFRCAYDCLPKNKMSEVRHKIKAILNVKSDKAVYDRIAGRTEPKISEATAIEQVFRNYGITIEWGAKIK